MQQNRQYGAALLAVFVVGSGAFAALRSASAQPVKASPKTSSPKWETYGNARYEFFVSFPSDLLIAQREADNGDGRAFVSRDGKTRMLAYGTNNALDETETLQTRYKHDVRGIKPGDKVTYKAQKEKWYAVSGYRGDLIFYRKTLGNENQFLTLDVTYPRSQRAAWDKIVSKVSSTFRIAE